ncbi:putative Ribosome biogenesis protein BRX1 [Glarea lozoyensis 74030]|uniref:Putative Ribosome biogenesis protein BRX1 n=1 Tax=Glarea lozoyensis (strain ATCC 74030 / MF5533) TaxID=1104152 RepID=H0ELI8_GLAL7|nr:putative Ribosome biogenesis protein BRX1 [Glarea lozoyensis 74030]
MDEQGAQWTYGEDAYAEFFGGPIIYENKEFVSPNQVRSEIRTKKAGRYNQRAEQGVERLAKKGELGLRTSGGRTMPVDELDTGKLFA